MFYRLGALRPGDRVRITRADGCQVTFRLATVTRYPQRNFPVEYGYGNLGRRRLTAPDPHRPITGWPVWEESGLWQQMDHR